MVILQWLWSKQNHYSCIRDKNQSSYSVIWYCFSPTDQTGYFVDYHLTLTAVSGCDSNALLLGSSEQIQVAAHNIGPYVDQNKTSLGESINVIYEEMEHAKKYTSIAKGTGTDTRFVQYVLTWIYIKLVSLIEIFDTQAASAFLGLKVSLSTESYAFVTFNLV